MVIILMCLLLIALVIIVTLSWIDYRQTKNIYKNLNADKDKKRVKEPIKENSKINYLLKRYFKKKATPPKVKTVAIFLN